MDKVTVSAKLPSDLVDRITQSGFTTSDVLQVAVEMFFCLPPEQQISLISSHIQAKKRKRAIQKIVSNLERDF